MIMEPKTTDYLIRELTYEKEAGTIRLHWRHREASDFLIFLYDSRQDFDLPAACKKLSDAGNTDQEIMEQTKKFLSAGRDTFWKAAYVRKADFQRDGRGFVFPANELKKGRPYGICVAAAVWQIQDGQLHVFPADARQNHCYLPVKISAEIRYKPKLFSKDRYCLLRLPLLEGYQDGSLLYRIEGVSADISLPQSCLGRELTIVLPRKAKVSVKVRENDQNYYSMLHGV